MKLTRELMFYPGRILCLFLCFFLGGNIASAQNIGGIGAQLSIDSSDGFKLPMVIKMVPNSPAAVSLKEGLYILSVNGNSCRDKSIQDVVALIRGEVGTHVILSVADNKQGSNTSDKDMVRIILPQAQDDNAGAADVQAFNDWCENEVKEIHKKRHVIVKTFNSDCGDFYFNFNADTGRYLAEVYILEDKGSGGSGTAFVATAKIFNNKNEADAADLVKIPSGEQGRFNKLHLHGQISFTRAGVGVINTQIHALGDVKKCMAMYIVVYK
jgi:PDZ domain-containing protein